MTRLPRRVRPYITRSEVLTAIVFAVAILWLALIAIGMGM
jgi:hypothetical protein